MHSPTATYYVEAPGASAPGYIIQCSDTFATLLRERGFLVREGR
jgi:hypothetical protein